MEAKAREKEADTSRLAHIEEATDKLLSGMQRELHKVRGLQQMYLSNSGSGWPLRHLLRRLLQGMTRARDSSTLRVLFAESDLIRSL